MGMLSNGNIRMGTTRLNGGTEPVDVPFYYIVIDESGVPYCTDGMPNVFVMSAIVTPDPEGLAAVPLGIPSNTSANGGGWVAPGRSELKHSRSSRAASGMFMRELDSMDVMKFSAVTWMDDPDSFTPDNSDETYVDTYHRLMESIASSCPQGIYRIRMDGSMRIDYGRFLSIARDAFAVSEGVLATRDAFYGCDSIVTPVIQAADMLAGEHLQTIVGTTTGMRKKDRRYDRDEYAKRNEEFALEHNVVLSKGRKGVVGPHPKGPSLSRRRRYRPMISSDLSTTCNPVAERQRRNGLTPHADSNMTRRTYVLDRFETI